MNGANLTNVIQETSRTFRNKKREYTKTKLMSMKETVRTKIIQPSMEA
jgi:hypothetical protein